MPVLKLLLLLVPILMTTACATTGTGVTDQVIEDNALKVCHAWLPISWSSRDTEQTRNEVKANNSARVAWGCPDERRPQ